MVIKCKFKKQITDELLNTPGLKELIKDNIAYIQAENWDQLYKYDETLETEYGELTQILLESDINPFSKTTKELPAMCFYNNWNLLEIEIPEGIEEIPPFCFSECEYLEKVTFPSTLKVIGNNAFSECASLKSIILPKNLEIIDNHAFYNCQELNSIKYNGTYVDRFHNIEIYESVFENVVATDEIQFNDGSYINIDDLED